MTKNRARVRATKELAQTAGIRHPDASYLADHRKLRLADGTIHDFTTGPLRYYGGKASGMSGAAFAVMKEAEEKGWRRERLLGKDFLAPERLLAYLRSDTFLVVLEHHAPGGPDAVTEAFEAALANGDYPDLNVLVTTDDLEENPARGRNIRCARAKVPMWRQVADFDKVELAKARIAFALRLAGAIDSHLDGDRAMKGIAADFDRFGTPEAAAIAGLARTASGRFALGARLYEVFAEHEELLGSHLVQIFEAAFARGSEAKDLRAAAAVLEADLRIGLIA